MRGTNRKRALFYVGLVLIYCPLWQCLGCGCCSFARPQKPPQYHLFCIFPKWSVQVQLNIYTLCFSAAAGQKVFGRPSGGTRTHTHTNSVFTVDFERFRGKHGEYSRGKRRGRSTSRWENDGLYRRLYTVAKYGYIVATQLANMFGVCHSEWGEDKFQLTIIMGLLNWLVLWKTICTLSQTTVFRVSDVYFMERPEKRP